MSQNNEAMRLARIEALDAAAAQLQEQSHRTITLPAFDSMLQEHRVEWGVAFYVLGGVERAIAQRDQEVARSVIDRVDLGAHKTREQVFGFKKSTATSVMPRPVKVRHVAGILLFERDLEKLTPLAEASGGSEDKELIILDSQKPFMKRLLKPSSVIAEELGVDRIAVNNRIRNVRDKNDVDQRELVKRLWRQGWFKDHKLPDVEIQSVLDSQQMQHVRRCAFDRKTDTLRWRSIHELLGTQTAAEAYVMDLRDQEKVKK